MRLVLDTNILVSALIVPGGPADALYQAWRAGRFRLLTSEQQLEEFRRVTRYPKVRKYIRPAAAGTMLNQIRLLAHVLAALPTLSVATDPADNFLLATAAAGQADYLVTGDKHHLLTLRRYERTQIISLREMADILR